MDNLFNKISDLYKVFLKQETEAAKPKRIAAYKKKEEEQAKKEALRKEKLRTTGMALIELAAIRENERKNLYVQIFYCIITPFMAKLSDTAG
jgi:hypothetical protein